MTGLTTFRDHCRKMSKAEHVPACPSQGATLFTIGLGGLPVACAGCVPESDRALFALLAAEVDEYLDRPIAPDLFGELTVEPARLEGDQ